MKVKKIYMGKLNALKFDISHKFHRISRTVTLLATNIDCWQSNAGHQHWPVCCRLYQIFPSTTDSKQGDLASSPCM